MKENGIFGCEMHMKPAFLSSIIDEWGLDRVQISLLRFSEGVP